MTLEAIDTPTIPLMLHANWQGSCLHLWATAAGGGTVAAPELRAAVGEIATDALIASAAAESTLAIWLPTGNNGTARMSMHAVPTLQLSAPETIDLLSSLPDPLPAECGPSLRYWAAMMRFVLSRVAAGQFFPDIDQPRADAFVGLWRLLIGGARHLDQLQQLAAAMPPSCRAAAQSDATDSGAILESFLATVVDAFIRRAVSHDEFFARVHELARQPESQGEVRWLSGLLGADRALVQHADNPIVADQVRTWVGRLEEARGKQTWRLCFELIEPELDDEAPAPAEIVGGLDAVWTLLFHLESGGEQIQRQDAAELWADPSDPAGVIGRSISERRAHLMAELQRSVEWCPPAARALESSTPSHVLLSTAEAHQFLRQWAGKLLDNSFGVIVPEWAKDRSQRLGMLLEVRPQFDKDGDELPPELTGNAATGATQLSSGKFGLDSLLDFDWQIAVGDLRLSAAEFQTIAQSRVPLIHYRGRWMEIDADAAGRMADFLAKKTSGQITLAEAFRTAFGISRTNEGIPILGISGSSWVENFLQQTPASKIENLTQPRGFAGTLRNYQLRGLDWLSFLNRLGIGACLADDMGLGKTIQLISLLLYERESQGDDGGGALSAKIGPTLLFAPTSVVGNWVKEVDRFAAPLKVLIHHGPERESGEEFARKAMEHDLVITSYALAHRDLEDLKRPTWHRLALDEAQKIKNPSAAAAVAIRSLVAPHRVALTGTPIENHLSELWSIMEMLNPGLLGTASEFRERFAIPIEKMADRDRAQQLRDMIRPFVLRRTKSDPQVAADLPEKMEMKVFCNLSAEQAAIYERITSDMLGQIDSAKGIRRRGLILAALTRLKQVCNHPVLATKENDSPRTGKKRHADSVPLAQLLGRSGKCERLLEMLEEVIEEGDAAIIFTQYREMGHLLETMIREKLRQPVQFLHGGTPAHMRDTMIDRFQKPGSEIRLFLLSLRAGGLGLNLTAANHVFHFDRWWNPAVESQATDRAHRIGQTRKVQVHKFVCVGTLEERIDRLLSDKLALADQIVSSGDEWLTNLSTDELRRYLSLSREAVAEF